MSKLKAGRTFDFVLEEFRGDPEADVFKLRVLSCDQQTEAMQVYREAMEAAKAKDPRVVELEKRLIEMILAVNPLEADVRSILTSSECSQLIAAGLSGASLTSDERKKFVLPLTSEVAKSAATVETNAPAE